MNLQQCLHYLLFLISEASYHSLCVYLWAMHKFASVIRDYPHLSQGKQKKKPLLFLRAIKHWHRSWSGPSREDAERCRSLHPWRDSNPDGTRPWETSSEQGAGLHDLQSSLPASAFLRLEFGWGLPPTHQPDWPGTLLGRGYHCFVSPFYQGKRVQKLHIFSSDCNNNCT